MPVSAPNQSHESCPACRRFIGVALTCPYCDQESRHHPLRQRLHLAAITLALAGLATLLLIAGVSTPPVISLTRVHPTMNHGHVTLSGPGEITGHLYLVAGKPPRLYQDGSHTVYPPWSMIK